MGAVVNLSWLSPSLEQIEELIEEALEALDDAPSVPSDHPIRLQAAQCRAALEASRRLSFGPFAQRALTEKALRVKVDALLHLRNYAEIRDRKASGTIPKGARSWVDEERERAEQNDPEASADTERDPSILPNDHI